MGYPSDVKSPEGTLPTYVPIPSDHDTPLSELPSAETRRRRLRTLLKHVVVLLFTGFIMYHVLKKSNKGVQKISCVDHWAGRHHKVYQLEKTMFGDAPHHPRVSSCDSWTNETSADESTYKFSFPVNATLDFFARGPFIGSVDYVLADEDSLTDSVEVEITLNGTDRFVDVGEEHAAGHRLASWLPQSWVKALKSIPKKKPIRAKAKVCQLQDRFTEEANGFVIVNGPPKHRHSPWWRHHRGEPDHKHPEPPHRGPGREPAPPSPPHSPDERHPHPHPPSPPKAPEAPHPHPHHPHGPAPPEVPLEMEEERHSHGHERLSKFSEHENDHRYARMRGDEDHGHRHGEPPLPPPPRHPHHHHIIPVIYAKVKITIPRGALEIPRLASILPQLETTVAPGVFDNVAFGGVVFVTKNLELDALNAKRAEIITHGTRPINGTYVMHDRLEIVAGEAPIIANITAYSSPNAHSETKIELVNRNATIDTSIALLLSKTVEDDGHLSNNGSFAIETVSHSADIVANVTAQPVSSTLHLSVVSRYANVTAFVPPAYEGEFTVITTGKDGQGEPHVNVAEGTEDPAGKGRERSISVREVLKSIIHGTAKWQEKDDLEEAVEDLTGGWILAELLEEEDGDVVNARVHPSASFGRSSVSLITRGGDASIFFV